MDLNLLVLPHQLGLPAARFDVAALHSALDAQRRSRRLTWKDVATESGVSASTLTRLSQGRQPDVKCRLCGSQVPSLRNSHIVPEFLYKDLYNDKGHMMAIRPPHAQHRPWRALQKGVSEKLFCESCEQHFNDHFEKPFLRQWLETRLPDPWVHDREIRIQVDDYPSFKLFHLSVLFRAGIAPYPTISRSF